SPAHILAICSGAECFYIVSVSHDWSNEDPERLFDHLMDLTVDHLTMSTRTVAGSRNCRSERLRCCAPSISPPSVSSSMAKWYCSTRKADQTSASTRAAGPGLTTRRLKRVRGLVTPIDPSVGQASSVRLGRPDRRKTKSPDARPARGAPARGIALLMFW